MDLHSLPDRRRLWNHRTTGHFGFLPAYGSMNLYIGNHSDTCRLQSIRPGPRWEKLKRLPRSTGVPGRMGRPELFFQGNPKICLNSTGCLSERFGFQNSGVLFIKGNPQQHEDLPIS